MLDSFRQEAAFCSEQAMAEEGRRAATRRAPHARCVGSPIGGAPLGDATLIRVRQPESIFGMRWEWWIAATRVAWMRPHHSTR